MFLVHLLSQTQGKEGCTSGTALDPFFTFLGKTFCEAYVLKLDAFFDARSSLI